MLTTHQVEWWISDFGDTDEAGANAAVYAVANGVPEASDDDDAGVDADNDTDAFPINSVREQEMLKLI